LRPAWLTPFTAGNFLYIGASDLASGINKQGDPQHNVINFGAFPTGLTVL